MKMSATSGNGPVSTVPVVASCQARGVALSGGWEATDFIPFNPVSVEESRRSGNGWQAAFQPYPLQISRPLTRSTYVVCLGNVPGASVQERVVNHPSSVISGTRLGKFGLSASSGCDNLACSIQL